ncbi:hypothetical protein DJ90_6344 [Paenibacillus macerans]|uniref:Uncharacterized protein n=1 Tax=Paenibacillus macerans TaxID=44252 RepID=A0A090Y9A1_PAEMA|nr:hypothetical protein DJ90_6344 [Paenibacillus macerans]
MDPADASAALDTIAEALPAIRDKPVPKAAELLPEPGLPPRRSPWTPSRLPNR